LKKWSTAFQLLAVGFYVPISLLIPTAAGFWFDTKLEHDFPSCALVGLAIGTIIMAYGVYQMVRPFLNEAKKIEHYNAEKKIHSGKPLISSKNKSNKKEQL